MGFMDLFDGFKKGSKIKDAYGFFTQGEFQEALKCYDEILEMDPNYVKAWYAKGLVFLQLEKPKESLDCFDKALEIDPKNVDVWNYKCIA